MDPELEKLAVISAVFGSKDLITKLLGPTADYIGVGLKNWTEKRGDNMKRIIDKATKRLGDKINDKGSIPPKVLREILEQGSFNDDEFAGEYFGGVLASSRSTISRDDRGATYTALISRLSSYQVRSHYFFYSLIKDVFNGTGTNIGIQEQRRLTELYIPAECYVRAMDFSPDEDVNIILPHVIVGLAREGLIEDTFSYGAKEHLAGIYSSATSDGLILTPSAMGIELFLWAHGQGNVSFQHFLDANVVLEADVDMVFVEGSKPTKMAIKIQTPEES